MKKKYLLNDTTFSREGNVTEKEAEKILKYKECQTKVIPVITGANGTISK
jgi:hypothetical protein